MRTVLLTGAAGYIASHTWLALAAAGWRVVGVDDHSNSSPLALQRIQQLLAPQPMAFYQLDVKDGAALDAVFRAERPDAVVHFAASKAVGESVAKPLLYYRNNLGGLFSLCEVMQAHAVHHLVFSSSATVYGDPASVPINEHAALSATNPYGQTKLMGETILRDLMASNPAWKVAILRYFNPVGAHDSGLIGEDPRGIPNNLMPYIAQVAVGRREKLQVFGNDYATPDGTGVRDYIHVCDLADGHVAALEYLSREQRPVTVNLGTGQGYSVLQVCQAYEQASGKPIPYEVVARRPGDIAACFADPAQARQLLGWQAQHGLARMCQDSWRWQQLNPHGYDPTPA